MWECEFFIFASNFFVFEIVPKLEVISGKLKTVKSRHEEVKDT
jgi:hypothetical protein